MSAERAQRAADEVVESPIEQEFSEFSYIVSHDLAAAFRHISGFMQLLESDLGDSLTDRQKMLADKVDTATSKCGRMLERMLEFSRMQQRELRREHVDATLAARSALKRLSGAEGADVAIAPLGTATVDGELFTLALSHLLDNALRFHAPGAPPCVRVSVVEADDAWIGRIRDHGVGVASDLRERAFRMFQRLEPELHPDGLGVGLTMARRIARRHGGEVRFIDAEEGACVEMRLPHAAALS